MYFFKVEIKPFALAKCREVTCSIRKSPQHQSCWVHGLRDMRCRVHERFYGTSENAVKTRIQIAVSLYVLVAIVCKRLELEAVSIRFVAIVRKRLELEVVSIRFTVSPFLRIPILEALRHQTPVLTYSSTTATN